MGDVDTYPIEFVVNSCSHCGRGGGETLVKDQLSDRALSGIKDRNYREALEELRLFNCSINYYQRTYFKDVFDRLDKLPNKVAAVVALTIEYWIEAKIGISMLNKLIREKEKGNERGEEIKT
jgi:hypothetical protein